MNIPEGLVCHPAVFAVEDTYQLLVLAKTPLLVSVLINGKEYASHVNGVRCSETLTHRITVPQKVLDTAGAYQLRTWVPVERPPYWPILADPKDYAYVFHPLTKTDDIRLYHIADAHGRANAAAAAALAAGERPDVLLFNGDLPNHCGDYQEMHTMLLVASQVAQGTLPCVCARGNHDLRGVYAENYIHYIPHHHGHTYYTFRLGCLWGVILDCGEDKPDTSNEYGGVICCHDFRVEETEFLRHITGYDAPDIRYRLVLSHNPFTDNPCEPFNIEVPLYTEWAQLLRERVKPHVMICGHTHQCVIYEEGGERDNKGQPCPIIVASKPAAVSSGDAPHDEDGYTGASIVLHGNTAQVTCNDNTGAVGMQCTVSLKDW